MTHPQPPGELTKLLPEWQLATASARDLLIQVVCQELRRRP